MSHIRDERPRLKPYIPSPDPAFQPVGSVMPWIKPATPDPPLRGAQVGRTKAAAKKIAISRQFGRPPSQPRKKRKRKRANPRLNSPPIPPS